MNTDEYRYLVIMDIIFRIGSKSLGRVYQNCILAATLIEKPAPTNLLMKMVQKMNFNTLFLTNSLSADAPL